MLPFLRNRRVLAERIQRFLNWVKKFRSRVISKFRSNESTGSRFAENQRRFALTQYSCRG